MSEEPYFKMHVNILKIYSEVHREASTLSHPTSPNVVQHFLQLKSQGRKDEFSLNEPT